MMQSHLTSGDLPFYGMFCRFAQVNKFTAEFLSFLPAEPSELKPSCNPRIIREKWTPEAVRKDRRGQTSDLIRGLRANMVAPNAEDSEYEVEELLWGLDHKSAWLWKSLTGGQPGHLRTHSKCCLDATSQTVRFYKLGLKVARSRNPSPAWPQPGWTWIFWT